MSGGILLSEGRFSIRFKDRALDCPCRITFDLTREHCILIECLDPLHSIHPLPMLARPIFFQASPRSEAIECFVIKSDERSVTLLPSSGVVVDRNSPLVRVSAAIVNFNRYWFGTPKQLEFRLEDEVWTLEFTPTGDETLQYPREIQNESYYFSHHLLLHRVDGKSFSCREAQDELSVLSTFLLFCADGWVAPALITGADQAGTAAMEIWSIPKIDAHRAPNNWLDAHHGNAMVEIFPKFSRLMKDPEWREALRTVVYWYVRANSNYVGPDGAIVLIQAALERLAWHVLVRHRQAVSEKDFGDLSAAGQLRLLLDNCSIPLRIPSLLGHLVDIAKGKRGEQEWIDGPQAFVAVRNQLVHPKKTRRIRGGNAYYEVLQLGKWYLEMVLLRAFWI